MAAAHTRTVGLGELVHAAVRGLPRLPGGARAALTAARSRHDAPDTIGSMVEAAAARWGALPALRDGRRVVTYAELDATSNRVARALAAAGVGRGDAVAVVLENRAEVLALVVAIVKLRAVAAMINTSLRGEALVHSLRAAGARWAVVGDELDGAWRGVSGSDAAAALRGVWGLSDGGDARAVFAAGDVPPRVGLDLAAQAAGASAAPIAALAHARIGDPCFYVFTSGTTGLPKASVMTHLRWVKAGAAYGIAMLALQPGEVVYAPMPLYHNLALTLGWASCVTTGACLAVRRKFSATEFWADCVAHGATAMCYIGEVPRYLMNTPPGPHDRAHRVRRMVGVGLRAELWRPFMARFGVERVCETYAASEGNTVFLNALNLDETIGFCPTPHALVRYDVQADAPLRDAAGRMQRVQPGEAGLLLGKVTPRFQFDGYTDPVASEKKLFRDVFAAGDVWFNSGDLLRKVGWGHAQFVDRVGDTFRWKGENVSTNEVELVISQVEGVAEATVYGVELAGAEGRVGMAAVVPVDPAIEGDALAARVHDACRAALPPYAVPAFVRLLGRLETTGTFKHQKAALRGQGWRADGAADAVFVFLPGTVAPLRVAPATEAAIAEARW